MVLATSAHAILIQNAPTRTATVPSLLSTPTSKANFLDGMTTIGTATLSNGLATSRPRPLPSAHTPSPPPIRATLTSKPSPASFIGRKPGRKQMTASDLQCY